MTVGSGISSKRWTLPKELLTHHSPFFAAALNGSFSEATSSELNLPEDDPKAFSSFVRWMYSGKVDPDPDAIQLAQAWVLGDKLGCLPFSDKALLELFDFHQGFPLSPDTIQFAYEKSVAGSMLRKWALAEFLHFTRVDYCEILDDSVVKALTELDDWGRDLTRALIVLGPDNPLRPYEYPSLYMQVLDDGTAKSLQRHTTSKKSCIYCRASPSPCAPSSDFGGRSHSTSRVRSRSRSTSRGRSRSSADPAARLSDITLSH